MPYLITFKLKLLLHCSNTLFILQSFSNICRFNGRCIAHICNHLCIIMVFLLTNCDSTTDLSYNTAKWVISFSMSRWSNLLNIYRTMELMCLLLSSKLTTGKSTESSLTNSLIKEETSDVVPRLVTEDKTSELTISLVDELIEVKTSSSLMSLITTLIDLRVVLVCLLNTLKALLFIEYPSKMPSSDLKLPIA